MLKCYVLCIIFKSTSSSTSDVQIHDQQPTSMPVLCATQIQQQVLNKYAKLIQNCLCETISAEKREPALYLFI